MQRAHALLRADLFQRKNERRNPRQHIHRGEHRTAVAWASLHTVPTRQDCSRVTMVNAAPGVSLSVALCDESMAWVCCGLGGGVPCACCGLRARRRRLRRRGSMGTQKNEVVFIYLFACTECRRGELLIATVFLRGLNLQVSAARSASSRAIAEVKINGRPRDERDSGRCGLDGWARLSATWAMPWLLE